MARIELDNIEKRWGPVVGVREVNLDIADEELVVFLGPSGCGKTTTMRMIAGLEQPTGGEIRMDGEVMNEVDARDRDVAMVFQGYALYPNMTIYENIRFPLRMRNVHRREHDGRTIDAAVRERRARVDPCSARLPRVHVRKECLPEEGDDRREGGGVLPERRLRA